MKKYIPLMILCVVFFALTSFREGLTTKKTLNNDMSYTYLIRTEEDWTVNEKTIDGIVSDTRVERCIVVYPIGPEPDKFFMMMDEKAPSEGPRVRFLFLYNKNTTAAAAFLKSLDVDESEKWKQSLFVYAKGSDKMTKQMGNITVL
jgi:hypothetical protein